MNSIDTRYHNVSNTDRFNDFFNCTNLKCGISIMYTSSLQFSAEEMVDTNSDRIVGIKLKTQIYRSLFIFGVYLPADGLTDNYRQELNVLDDLHYHITLITAF